MLARRDFSSGELRTRLTDRGFDPQTVGAVAQALERDRLLNDARYVEQFVSYHAGRGQGPARIARELKSLGLDPELIERALDKGPDWIGLARQVRQKRFGRNMPADYAGKAKQARFLQYRGFTGAQIRQALGTDIDLDDDA